MVRTIRRGNMPPNNDDEGGTPPDENLPVIDLPPGSHLEDYLVDRWYAEAKTLRISWWFGVGKGFIP